MPLGSTNASRSDNRRIDSLSRERESISRILTQAGLDRIELDIEALKEKLDSIEELLSGSSNYPNAYSFELAIPDSDTIPLAPFDLQTNDKNRWTGIPAFQSR